MITYGGGFFGLSILFRLHGSAVFKSLTPAFLSSIVYVLLYEFTDLDNQDDKENALFAHPYPMAALITAFSFLLTFRANFAYNRYWEAMTQIHLMQSKFLDFGTEITAFHYQSERYDSQKPPAFGAHPELTAVMNTRERDQREEFTKEELEQHIDECVQANQDINGSNQQPKPTKNSKSKMLLWKRWFGKKKKTPSTTTNKNNNKRANSANMIKDIQTPHGDKLAKKKKVFGHKKRRATDFMDSHGNSYQASAFQNRAQETLAKGHLQGQHPLFLEECAHLLSLLSAVAFSTLRNDLEEAESPLAEFKPNVPWPHVDPDAYGADVRKGWERGTAMGCCSSSLLQYLLGVSRTDKKRTMYNAGRPFRVIGNVSDQEIALLSAARGPSAKVALVSLWLQEFLSREYQAGSTGKVAPPIISRLYQFVSDGMAGYNQARKVAYIPFPFPHAQITTLFILVSCCLIPFLMMTYVTNEFFGFFLNLCCVMVFTGLHEVARELENPFQNVPNDIPLNNFQAQFNEGLMVMFFGYHPDLYWQEQQQQQSDKKDENNNNNGDHPVIPTSPLELPSAAPSAATYTKGMPPPPPPPPPSDTTKSSDTTTAMTMTPSHNATNNETFQKHLQQVMTSTEFMSPTTSSSLVPSGDEGLVTSTTQRLPSTEGLFIPNSLNDKMQPGW